MNPLVTSRRKRSCQGAWPDTHPMDLHDSPEDAAFRAEARAWLEANLTGDFAEARGLGRAGLAARGPRAPHWPGSASSARTAGPVWAGPASTAAGAPRCRSRSSGTRSTSGPTPRPGSTSWGRACSGPPSSPTAPRRRRTGSSTPSGWGTELWCQGYSEPDAGSDLANVQTKAVLDGDEWVITGQKVWTSYAQWSDWCFVVCRTDPEAPRHRGLSYLLVPMDQPGVEVRPIRQITGTSEFNEVFFDGARTDADLVVGEVNDGWRVALATLAFERGVGLLGDIVGFRKELDHLLELARKNGRTTDTVCASGWPRSGSASTSSGSTPCARSPAWTARWPRPQASISKLFWATWHRDLGELAMDVLGIRRPGGRRAALRAQRPATHLPVHPGRHHLRRVERDPAQHHRRARPRAPPEPKVAATSKGVPSP